MSQQALDCIAENIRTKNPVLDLGNCGLTELYPKLLDELAKTGEWLEELILGSRWWDWKAMKSKKSQNSGRKNRLPLLPPTLPPFAQLKTLIANELGLTDCAPLAGFTALSTLHISINRISDCAPLAGLTALNALDISSNQITDCAPLAGLTALNALDISINKISDCAPLAGLTALNKLDISRNQITDCSPLAGLTALNKLDIYSNQISDCAPLAGLTALNALHIYSNQISDCVPLADLTALSTLDISINKISDCAPLAGLTALSTLHIYSNQISDCAPLAGLTALSTLHISDNQISDCAPLAGLTALSTLYIFSNRISKFPFTLLDSCPQLKDLWLWGNPIQNIDKSVYDKPYINVLAAVKDFVKDLRQGSSQVYASKLVLVGNGRVGKTCLVKRWLDDSFDAAENSTHAIQLRRYPLDKLAQAMGLESLQLNIWDFGGQDIYHATHQVFLKTNALFLLVWDAETEAQPVQTETLPDRSTVTYTNHPLRYWLSYIKTLSNNSPVLLIQTKAGKALLNPSAPPGLTMADWGQFNICGALAVESSWDEDNGFRTLEEKLRILLRQQITQQCTQLPTSWYLVRQQIEQWQAGQRKQVPLDHFEQLCAANGLDSSSTQTLLQYLHDTGTLFYQEGLFGNQLVIDQQWAIDAVYALFDRQKPFFRAFRNNGFFTGQDLQTYWEQYTAAEQELFISFMQSCKICVEINPRKYNEPEKPFVQRQFLAPQLLPADGTAKKDMSFDDATGPCLVYKASLLHPAVIQAIIVQLAFLSNRYDMWANGIIIKTDKGKALIEAAEDKNELRVQLYRAEQLGLLETLQKAISEIVRYDAELETLVSLDGNTYISLQQLAKWPVANPQMPVGEQWVATAPYRRFLQQPDKATKEKEENPLADLRPEATEKAAVFFSYAWKDDVNEAREEMVDALYETLSKDLQDHIVTHRDKKDVQYGDLISDYMKRIGRGRHIFVFISDKYLRSAYCMYELHLAYAANCSDTNLLKEVIYPVRVENISLGKPSTRKLYADYWKKEITDLELYVNEEPANRTDSAAELKKIRRIREDLDRLLLFLSDICTPDTIELQANNFEQVKAEIQRRLQG